MCRTRTRRKWISALVVVALFGLVACAPRVAPGVESTTPPPAESTGAQEDETPAGSHEGAVDDYDGLLTALREHGVAVEPAGEIRQPFFPVVGRALKLDGQDVQVFEFEDPEAVEAVVKTIGPSGSEVGGAIVEWVAPPHFYRSGRLLVLYVGEDISTREALASVLGPQFAGR